MRQRTRAVKTESPDSGPLLSSRWSRKGPPQGLRGLECLRDPVQHHGSGLGSSLILGMKVQAHSSSGYISSHSSLLVSFLGSCSFFTGLSLPFCLIPRPMFSLSCSLSEYSQMALEVKNLSANAGDLRDADLIPELGRSPGGGNGNPLQYSCLENPMDRGAWRTIVHRVTEVDMNEVT